MKSYVLVILGIMMLTANTFAAQCQCNCTLNYDPVCAVDSRGDSYSFPNTCSLACYNCTHDTDYVVRRRGECSASSSTKRPSSRARNG